MNLTNQLSKITKLLSRSGNYFSIVYFVCSGVSAFYSIYYALCGLSGIALYEFFTFIIYLPVIYMARIDHPYTGALAYFEFIHHQIFSIYTFGFESGFWLLLCCMYFAHFLFFAQSVAQLGATMLTTALVFGFYAAHIYDFSFVFSPTLSERTHLIGDIFLINLIFAIGFMTTSGIVIHVSTNGRIDSLMNLVYKDFLTGLFNRKYILECVWPKACKEPLQIAIADIDDFKRINDTYGHEQGDVVLKYVSFLMQRASNAAVNIPTTLARWGGEEFLIMAQTDDLDGFLQLLERIRSELASSNIIDDGTKVSISIGAIAHANELGFTQAFEQADKNLYVAKRTGKNTIII